MKEREELLLAMVNIPEAIIPQGIGMSQQTSTLLHIKKLAVICLPDP